MKGTWVPLLLGSGALLLLVTWQQVPTILVQDVDSPGAGGISLSLPAPSMRDARQEGQQWLESAMESREEASPYSAAPPQQLILDAQDSGAVLIPTDDARMLPPDEKKKVSRVPGFGNMWKELPVTPKASQLANGGGGLFPRISFRRAAPIKRVSVFDQWTGPANGPALENPQLKRFDANKAHTQCTAKCANRPGWNPTEEVRDLCMQFCDKMQDDSQKRIMDVQPKHHSWWLRGHGRSRYEGNQFATTSFSSDSNQVGEMLLETSASAQSPDGLDGVEYGSKKARNDLDSYFDTLPTTDCVSADCSYPDSKAITVKKASPGVTPGQLKAMERKVLGYHRREEDALASAELGSLDKESASLVDGTNKGYRSLETASKQAALARKDNGVKQAKGTEDHSAAYTAARKGEKGFQGYYDNVFAKHSGKAKAISKGSASIAVGGVRAEARAVAEAALIDAEKILRSQLAPQNQVQAAAHTSAPGGDHNHAVAAAAVGNQRVVDGMLGYDPRKVRAMERHEWMSLEKQSKF